MVYSKRKENRKFTILKYLGLFLLVCGLFALIYYYANIKNLNDYDNNKIENFFDSGIVDNQIEKQVEDISENTSFTETDYNYIAVLEIPSISLKRGLVSPDSYYNNVNYNIQIIEHSTMPDVVNGNLILAGHNGVSYYSFFKNIYKLKQGDKVYIYYGGVKYEYTINTNYDTSKDNKIEIYRDHKKSTITLITCKRNTNDTQIVYIGYLTNKEKY